MPSKIFEPLRIGRITLNHRVIMAPLTRLRANDSHVPEPISAEYYAQRASVPGTFLIAEATLISARGGGGSHAPGLYTGEQVRGWKQITDAVHAKGSYIFCQLVALGRAADPETLKRETGLEVRAPSSIAMENGGNTPECLTDNEIWNLVQDFASAAKRAMEAGFDGVEIHGANGYLVDQFLHENSNNRTDQWGGSIAKRAKFGLEVAKAVVHAVGPDRVGFRLSPWNTWQGMDATDPVPLFCYLIKHVKEIGLAYLHLIESRVLNNVDCESAGNIMPFMEEWGSAKPVLVAGGYNQDNFGQALERDYKDYNVGVVFGRYFLANPDLPFRLRHGIPLQKYNRSTFYAVMESRGYTDYPFSPEFEQNSRDNGNRAPLL